MPKIIAVANQKGGVGKSVTTRNLAEALSLQGQKVLMIDFDPQGSLSIMCDLEMENIEVSVAHLIEEAVEDVTFTSKEEVVKKVGRVDIIPSDIGLASIEVALVNVMNRRQMLEAVVDEFKVDYDFVLIDCSPSLGMLTINALTAAHSVIIPVTPQFLSAKGVEMLLQSIVKIKRRINPNLQVEGILLTMYDKRAKLTKEIESMIVETYQEEVNIFDTRIPMSVKTSEATLQKKSIIEYAPKNMVSKAYEDLAREIITHG